MEQPLRALNDPGGSVVSMKVKPDHPSRRRLRFRLAGTLAFVAAGAFVIVLTTPQRTADPGAALPAPPEPADTTPPPSPTVPGISTTAAITSPSTTLTAAPITADNFSDGPVFSETTGIILLLDDGLSGLIAVDPDSGLVARSGVEGQRPGDEPYSMIRVGDKLVVGWGEPHATDITTREGMSLGVATIFVPAAEPDRVWMIDHGARIGARPPEVWQVEVDSGTPLHDPTPLNAEGFPVIGIPGGLALQTMSGLKLWLMDTGDTQRLEADSPGFTVDVHDDSLIWCGDPCWHLISTNTSSLETELFDPPEGYDRFLTVGQFSPNGRYLAVLVGTSEGYEGRAIWILDRETGETMVVSDPETRVDYLGWALDGNQLFATSYSYGGVETTVWRYQVSTQTLEAAVLPFGGAIRLVVVDSSVADPYLGHPPAD